MKADEAITLINHIEGFVLAVVRHHISPSTENAAILNKHRGILEQYIFQLAGIKEEKIPDVYKCPDCGEDMIQRRNRNEGTVFYGCPKYPVCRGTRDANGLSKAEKEELRYKKEQVNQESGFSFNRAKRNPVTEVAPQEPDFNPFKR